MPPKKEKPSVSSSRVQHAWRLNNYEEGRLQSQLSDIEKQITYWMKAAVLESQREGTGKEPIVRIPRTVQRDSWLGLGNPYSLRQMNIPKPCTREIQKQLNHGRARRSSSVSSEPRKNSASHERNSTVAFTLRRLRVARSQSAPATTNLTLNKEDAKRGTISTAITSNPDQSSENANNPPKPLNMLGKYANMMQRLQQLRKMAKEKTEKELKDVEAKCTKSLCPKSSNGGCQQKSPSRVHFADQRSVSHAGFHSNKESNQSSEDQETNEADRTRTRRRDSRAKSVPPSILAKNIHSDSSSDLPTLKQTVPKKKKDLMVINEERRIKIDGKLDDFKRKFPLPRFAEIELPNVSNETSNQELVVL